MHGALLVPGVRVRVRVSSAMELPLLVPGVRARVRVRVRELCLYLC